MPDSVSLTCPNCAGRLQIPPDVDRFACMHCGTELIVKRGGGIVLLNPVSPGLSNIPPSTERPPAEPPQAPPADARPASEPPQVQPEVERPAAELAKVQSGAGHAASEKAIQQLEPEIAAISQQINDLSAQMQQALADLAADEQAQSARQPAAFLAVSAQAPFYVRWFQSRALWKSLVGGGTILTLLACLFFCVVAVADPGQTRATTDPETGETVGQEKTLTDTSTVFLCCCCLAYPLAMLVLCLGVFATWSYQRKAQNATRETVQQQAQPFAAEREAQQAALVQEFQAKRTPLEAELARKKQQLAEHRRVVDD